jgi:hypothetical protein
LARRDLFLNQSHAGSLWATSDAPLISIALSAGYPQAIETTNESTRIKF